MRLSSSPLLICLPVLLVGWAESSRPTTLARSASEGTAATTLARSASEGTAATTLARSASEGTAAVGLEDSAHPTKAGAGNPRLSRNLANVVDKNIPAEWSIQEGARKNIKWSVKIGTQRTGYLAPAV